MSAMPGLRWHEMTALFGGTFDPPHIGHREAVRSLFQNPGVSRVLILPSPIPPLKSAQASTKDRIEMVRRCFAATTGDPFPAEIGFDLREIERARANPGKPTYSYDTLMELRSEIRNLAFVIGADQLAQISSWFRFPEVLELCHWIVLARKPDGQKTALEAVRQLVGSSVLSPTGSPDEWRSRSGSTIKMVETSAPAVSSTSIREIIAKTGVAPEELLVPEVQVYLKLHCIYGTRGEE